MCSTEFMSDIHARSGVLAQLVRALACHARGHGFKSRTPRHEHPAKAGKRAGQVNGGNGEKAMCGGLRFVRRTRGLHAPLMEKYPFEVLMFRSSGRGTPVSHCVAMSVRWHWHGEALIKMVLVQLLASG